MASRLEAANDVGWTRAMSGPFTVEFEHVVQGRCHGNRTERSRGKRHVRCHAAVAAFHVAMASALKVRSVRRETRWGWSEKVF